MNFVSFWDATRFANWLHNGQPVGAQDDSTTEDGSHEIVFFGGEEIRGSGHRKTGSRFFLPRDDEWYKAAYDDEGSSSYFQYPAGTDTQTTCAGPGSDPNTANCDDAARHLVPGGSYTASASPSGTFDQGGNCHEWNEAIGLGSFHRLSGRRGGVWSFGPRCAECDPQGPPEPAVEGGIGFRAPDPCPERRRGWSRTTQR